MSNQLRYLDTRAFGALLAELRLTRTVFQDGVLLERAGAVCRIRHRSS